MTTQTHSLTPHRGICRPGRLFAALMAMIAVRRQRRQLRDLDGAVLADLGLSRAQALRESRRPAWDVTTNRCR